jgi:hypothetical protein
VTGGSTVVANSPNYAMVGDQLWFEGGSNTVITQNNPRSLSVQDSARFKMGGRLKS